MTLTKAVLLFALGIALAQVETWLSIRCVEAGGVFRTGWFVDHCERAPK